MTKADALGPPIPTQQIEVMYKIFLLFRYGQQQQQDLACV